MTEAEVSSGALPTLAPRPQIAADKPAEPPASAPVSAAPASAKRSRQPKNKDKDQDKDKDGEEGVGIEELLMPRSIISRLAKSALPPNTAIGKDALLALSKCATVFISLLAGGAQENLEKVAPNRKTILPGNVLGSVQESEFDFMVKPLEKELEMYLILQAQKKEEARRKVRDGEGVDGSLALVGDEDSVLADGGGRVSADPAAQLEAESNIDRERSAKRGKGLDGSAVTRNEDEDDVDMDDGQDDVPDEDEADDDDATEDEEIDEPQGAEEDRIDTDPEDEPDEREGSEEDSD